MSRTTYSIWEDDDGAGLVRGPGPLTTADGRVLQPRRRKVLEFAAASWDEACRVMHDHYGWAPYISDGRWEDTP